MLKKNHLTLTTVVQQVRGGLKAHSYRSCGCLLFTLSSLIATSSLVEMLVPVNMTLYYASCQFEFLAKARTEIEKTPTLSLHDTSLEEVQSVGGKRVVGGRWVGRGWRERGGRGEQGREKGREGGRERG